ncbi:MAG: hypothetical protein ACE5KF_12720 [Kiloniellaceae bacterium]
MQPMIRSFDRHLPPDVRHVAEAADVLGLPEFELFQAAHRWRFGGDARDGGLDQAFTGCLLRQDAPYRVRHFGREVLYRACTGRLDPRRFGIDRPASDDRRAMPGRLYASLVTFAGFVAYLIFLA